MSIKEKVDEKSEVFYFSLPILKVIQADRLEIFARTKGNGFHSNRFFRGLLAAHIVSSAKFALIHDQLLFRIKFTTITKQC